MMTVAQVHKVRQEPGSKVKAIISLIVSEPDEIIRIRLFDIHEKNGLIEQFKKLQGKMISVPVTVEIYNGNLSYSLSYGAQIKEIK